MGSVWVCVSVGVEVRARVCVCARACVYACARMCSYPTFFPLKAFIEPDLRHAQIQIVNKFNPFSGLLNPVYILKSLNTVTVDDVLNTLSENKEGPIIAKYYGKM